MDELTPPTDPVPPVPAVPAPALSSVAGADVPLVAPSGELGAPPPPRRNFTRLATPALWLLLVAICVSVIFWARSFGTRVVQSQPVNARIEITNPPAWLDRRIVQTLLDESYTFAAHDRDTYDRTRNILDAGILKEIANLYTGTDADGKSRQTTGYNAWISKITQVRRAVAQDNGMQSIQISAQWRIPSMWIRVEAASGPRFFLIDSDTVRLPGEYRAEDVRGSPLMTIAGVGSATDPIAEPGDAWFTGMTARDVAGDGGDAPTLPEILHAGMKLAGLLQTQKFAPQIAAIDLSNFGGRNDPRGAWMSLETIWPNDTGTPRTVAWGRPIGEEKYYEVQANAKIKTLKELYAKYGRIDANRNYVDIRTDYVRTPKVAVQGNGMTAPHS